MGADRPRAFRPGHDDPVAYDRHGIEYLVDCFGRPIEMTADLLRAEVFAFPTMQDLHEGNLDLELLYRQCLPAAGIAAGLGLPVEETARFLALFATCQTLILNNVDRHLDLSSSYTLRDPTALLRDVHAVTCYAIAQLYRGMAVFGPSAGRALGEMAAVSLQIVQSMYDNYARRFHEQDLADPGPLLQTYRHPIRSPHVGSGFYSSSILGLYSFFGLDAPKRLPGILLDMRRLRQRVDELSDIFEDTATGLLSYPVARLLAIPEHHEQAVGVITEMWRRARQLVAATSGDAARTNAALTSDGQLRSGHARLLDLLSLSGVAAACHAEADALWRAIRTRLRIHSDPSIGNILLIVVDLKRAFLERLSAANWADVPPEHTFTEIRSAVMGNRNDG